MGKAETKTGAKTRKKVKPKPGSEDRLAAYRELTAQVRSEIKLARHAGVTHKLTFVINGRVVEGWEDDGRLEDAVTLALGDADKLIAEGLPSEKVARAAMQRGSPISKQLAALLE